MKKFIIEPQYSNYKVSQYLREVKGYSGRSLRNIECYLDGKRVKTTKKLRKLNRLVVKEKDKGTDMKPIKMDLNIVYEDDNIILIDKEPYIIVHPTQKKVDKTLAHGIIYYMHEKTGKILAPRFYNRLDMNTTGIIVVAKNAYTQAFLQDKAEVKKYYQAIVKGIVEEDELMVEKPLGKEGDELRRKVMLVEKGGQDAKTLVKVIKRYPEKDLTLVELELFTGRTHQIRAHMESLGHPILGDELYGAKDVRARRQMLHSYKLEFTNPDTLLQETIEIELPEDMKEILR
ncbi:RluA family pseudouridine synthase [uncultured Ilyobacter sp.]|uniref:RluA family pseudouridine synthase n=1 Tax=uncultured Ilyobacter sp. TaxID=544433 RepID=UPI0029C0E7FA|nr:RluA family pseudouridine synthase [uncultured Ilyobacter sp.]